MVDDDDDDDDDVDNDSDTAMVVGDDSLMHMM